MTRMICGLMLCPFDSAVERREVSDSQLLKNLFS